jgi:hypothetical protein
MWVSAALVLPVSDVREAQYDSSVSSSLEVSSDGSRLAGLGETLGCVRVVVPVAGAIVGEIGGIHKIFFFAARTRAL